MIFLRLDQRTFHYFLSHNDGILTYMPSFPLQFLEFFFLDKVMSSAIKCAHVYEHDQNLHNLEACLTDFSRNINILKTSYI